MGLNADHLKVVPSSSVLPHAEPAMSVEEMLQIQAQADLLIRLMGNEIDLHEFTTTVSSEDPVDGLLESLQKSKQIDVNSDKVAFVLDESDPRHCTVWGESSTVELLTPGEEGIAGLLTVVRLKRGQSLGDIVAFFGTSDPEDDAGTQTALFFRQTGEHTYEPIAEDESQNYWDPKVHRKPEHFMWNTLVTGMWGKSTIEVSQVVFLRPEIWDDGPDGGIPEDIENPKDKYEQNAA